MALNEVCYEETAFPSGYAKQKVFLIICKVVNVLFGISASFFAFMLLMVVDISKGEWVVPLIFFISNIGSIVFICLVVKTRLYNCYDFIFVSGEVRIIKVVNTKRRKKVVVFDSKDVFQVGKFESETYQKLKGAPDMKTIFCPPNKYVADKEKYYIAVNSEGIKYLVVLECTEMFLKHILMFSSKSVLEREFK